MNKLFRFILFSSHKRRRKAVGVTLWLLRQVFEIEKDEMYRYSDQLDCFDVKPVGILRHDYIELEEQYSCCEYVLGFLESAIEDLEYVY